MIGIIREREIEREQHFLLIVVVVSLIFLRFFFREFFPFFVSFFFVFVEDVTRPGGGI
jgi:hypothetical protein